MEENKEVKERKGPQFIIKDFLAVREAKINVKGLTTLHGDSNAGKSSILKSIHAATHNRFKKNQVRFGQEFITVKVKWDDDPRVLSVIRRPTGSPTMVLGKGKDQEIFSKMTRSVPPEVEKFNNLGVLKVADDLYSLNFMSQFEKPLLLEYSQKKVMQILSASKGLDDWNKAHAELEERRKSNRGSFASVDSILNDTKEKLSERKAQLQKIAPLTKKLEASQKTYLTIDTTLSKIAELDALMIEHSAVRIKEALLNEITKAIKEHGMTMHKLESIKDLGSYIDQTVITDKRIEVLKELLATKETMSKVSTKRLLIEDTLSLIDEESLVAEKLDLCLQKTQLAKEFKVNTEMVKGLTEIQETFAELSKCNAEIKEHARRNELLKDAAIVSNEIKLCTFKVSTADSLLLQIEELEITNININKLRNMIDNQLCPTCLSKLKEGHEQQH